MKFEFSQHILKNTQNQISLKIRPAVAEFFDPNNRADRQTRQSLESFSSTIWKSLKNSAPSDFDIFQKSNF